MYMCMYTYMYRCSLGDHIPEVKAYRFSDLMMDLVSFAARFLVMGGRLVYWVPMVKSE